MSFQECLAMYNIFTIFLKKITDGQNCFHKSCWPWSSFYSWRCCLNQYFEQNPRSSISQLIRFWCPLTLSFLICKSFVIEAYSIVRPILPSRLCLIRFFLGLLHPVYMPLLSLRRTTFISLALFCVKIIFDIMASDIELWSSPQVELMSMG